MNQKPQSRKLSDDYLYIIYDPLYKSLLASAKKIKRIYLDKYPYNIYSNIGVEDLIQIGFEGIFIMDDGYPISVYHSRGKNRMLNYIRDIRAKYRDDRNLLTVIKIANDYYKVTYKRCVG